MIPPITADGDAATSDSAELPPLPPVHSGYNEPSAQALELAQILVDAHLTIAVAESLTGGELASELVRVPGISESFLGGIVAYQDEIKHSLLDVDQRVLHEHGSVHKDVALQMAEGVREKFEMHDRHADIGISTTGVAGPDPSAKDQPAGTVFIGISSLWGEHVAALDFSNLVREEDPIGSRQRIRFATVEAALFNLLEHLAIQAEL
ncbi:MAG: CinA family protein [Gulosibacter sp.]|uniref:CinA family protein n=1 Tax=Gulosibacter sp. TaxID=2817531 RepID=UPI003F9112B1